ncbi:anti-anti-sigma factor [Catenulispora sp. GAS73]
MAFAVLTGGSVVAAHDARPAPELPEPHAHAPTLIHYYGPGGQLAVAARAARDGVVLTVSGELDIAVAAALGTRVDAALAQGHIRLVVNLRDLTFCDCAGLTALLRARRLAMERDGWVRLAAVQPRVARIIQIAGLVTVLPCHPDNAAAFNGSLLASPAATSGPPPRPPGAPGPPAVRSRHARQRPPPVAWPGSGPPWPAPARPGPLLAGAWIRAQTAAWPDSGHGSASPVVRPRGRRRRLRRFRDGTAAPVTAW